MGGGGGGVLGYFIVFAFLSSTQIYTAVCNKVCVNELLPKGGWPLP